MLQKIVSGGQTGVDRAALDAALATGLPAGGWCPRGRRAEDGTVPNRYPLMETPSAHFDQRTEWNVRDSDGTLVLRFGAESGGTSLTIDVAGRLGKPVFVLEMPGNGDVEQVMEWVRSNGIQVLNVAGPRASEAPSAYEEAERFLTSLFNRGRENQGG